MSNKLKKGLFLIRDYSLSGLDTFNEEILAELQNAKYNDVADMVYETQLIYDEIKDITDLKFNPSKKSSYSIPTRLYEIIDIKFMLKNILLKEVKLDITIDKVRLKSNLKINQTLIFAEKIFVLFNFRFYPITFLYFR